jgi:HlyD family secretion protein
MIHTTSEESLHESLDQSTDELVAEGVEQKEPKHSSPKLSPKEWGLIVGGLLLLTGGTWAVLQMNRSPNTSEAPVTQAIAVSTLTLRSQSIANTLELSGTIRPIEKATLSTRVSGRIIYFPLDAGDSFSKGDVVARIDVQDIAAQANQAESGVNQAKADLYRSQATLNQTKAQKQSAEAALRLAQISQGRSARLHREGAISQADLDQANTTLTQAQGQVAQTEAGIQQAVAAIDQSQAAINQAKAGVAAAVVNESYGTIFAPFDGVVVEKMAYEGETTNPYSMNGTALLKIENPNRLELEISVPEKNLRYVRVGQSVKVQFDAVNQNLNATIQQIVPAADPKSRSFMIKIPLNNSGKLISGMFGRIDLPVGERKQTLLIPSEAMFQRGQLQGVYVFESRGEQSIAVLRWVKTGKTQNGQVEIVSGLMAGDRIITDQISQLSDMQPISVKP